MFKPFYVFIGWRYARSQKKQHFATFISLISVIGIALGVMVLITVLSIMNGFRSEIQKSILSVNPHIVMHLAKKDFVKFATLTRKLKENKSVSGAAPFINGYALLMGRSKAQPIMVRGIDAHYDQEIFSLKNAMVMGNMDKFFNTNFAVAISQELAYNLQVKMGDKLVLLVPDATISLQGIQPRLKRFVVTTIYQTNTIFDKQYIFINLSAAMKLYRTPEVYGIELRLKDGADASAVALQLNKAFDFSYHFVDWTKEFANFLQAINMEKIVMACILVLILMVAVFNLVSSLFMIVTDKRQDIAILRVMGAQKKDIIRIFVIHGLILGVLGSLIGLILGLLLASNVTTIVGWLQRIFNINLIDPEIYFITYVPSIIHEHDVILIVLSAVVLSLIATIYPAFKAASIAPSEALRYE